jgi:hypothetical protein
MGGHAVTPRAKGCKDSPWFRTIQCTFLSIMKYPLQARQSIEHLPCICWRHEPLRSAARNHGLCLVVCSASRGRVHLRLRPNCAADYAGARSHLPRRNRATSWAREAARPAPRRGDGVIAPVLLRLLRRRHVTQDFLERSPDKQPGATNC